MSLTVYNYHFESGGAAGYKSFSKTISMNKKTTLVGMQINGGWDNSGVNCGRFTEGFVRIKPTSPSLLKFPNISDSGLGWLEFQINQPDSFFCPIDLQEFIISIQIEVPVASHYWVSVNFFFE